MLAQTPYSVPPQNMGHPTRNTKNTKKVGGHCDCWWPLDPEGLGVVIHQKSLIFKQNLPLICHKHNIWL